MLVGDNVFVEVNKNIFRPSDIGQPVTVSNVWTLKFNYGIVLNIFGSPEFLVDSYENSDRLAWLSLDNISSSTRFGARNPLYFPNVKWNSKVKLDDYLNINTGKVFDIGDIDFARFAGWFCFVAKPAPSDLTVLRVSTKYIDNLEYAQKLFPENSIYEEGSYFYFKKCWVTELLDVIFDFTNKISLPDEIIYSSSDVWLESFVHGLFSKVCYDPSSKSYRTSAFDDNLVNDLSVITQRVGIPFEVSFTDASTRFKFPKGQTRGTIVGGFENKHPILMYDIGKGEFNVSGIMMRDL